MLRDLGRESAVTRRLERFNWRSVFFLVLLISWMYAGTLLRNHEPPRPAGEKAVLVSAWIATIALYGWLAWGQGRSSRTWMSFDVTAMVCMTLVAVHAAAWPAFWAFTRPARFAGSVAAASFGSVLGYTLRMRQERAKAAAVVTEADAAAPTP